VSYILDFKVLRAYINQYREHVYRNHLLPIMCLRCSETFETEKELREHSQSEATCPVRKSDREGCSKQQWIEIRSQKDIRSKTGVEKWKGMYRILFPDQKIPSPCKAKQDVVTAPAANICKSSNPGAVTAEGYSGISRTISLLSYRGE
jgi:hypothetical protein